MEIKSVKNEVKNEYPKLEKPKKKNLHKNISKISLTSIGITLLTKKTALASIDLAGDVKAVDNTSVPVQLAGDVVSEPVPVYLQICEKVFPILLIISILSFIITGLNILLTKFKSKKSNNPIKIKKWIKVLFILSILLILLCILFKIFYHCC